MQWTGLNELREKYLSFFESKGHLRLPSFPLIPKDDNSLLLINSGMAPMKKYFTGEVTPPRKRVTTCQKCIRTPDIERVGITARHGTYFEMLGNFSFGDYFKREVTAWAWEFITKVLEMPEDKLWVTIYQDDDEAFDIWTKEVGVDPTKIVRLGKEDNFWEHGSGPCGPCSEIHFDRGPEYGCGKPDCKPGCDCDRYMEFWNLVFTQFDNDGHNNYTPLAHPNIDTGMGLERLACVMQGVDNLFLVDTVQNIMKRISRIAGIAYGESEKTDISLRVITDHIRSTTFMISDGVMPSNEGRGYVLRRLLRRAARHGRLLGINHPFLSEVVDTVIAENEVAYPELREKSAMIKKVISFEEESFYKTIDKGFALLNNIIDRTDTKILSGEDAFKLSDTFGFPIDLTKEILSEKGMEVDEDKFRALVLKQRETTRARRKNAGADAWAGDSDVLEGLAKTEFVGYTKLTETAKITAIVKDGARVESAETGDDIVLTLDRTPFYAESGGQVGDTGVVKTDSCTIRVLDTTKNASGVYIHKAVVEEGFVREGDEAQASVDAARRQAIMRNHTAAHLLQAALRRVLGDHVEQAGQLVNEHTVRFDFTHFSALTDEELLAVEQLVNEKILENIAVECREMPIEEAKKLGAMALFGEKYGNVVRVVSAGDFSKEFCGGTHIDFTAKLGLFKIVSESSVAAGVRRIEGVTGMNLLEMIYTTNHLLKDTTMAMKVSNPTDLPAKAAQLFTEMKEKDREIESMRSKIAALNIGSILENSVEVKGVKVVTAMMSGTGSDALRTMCDKIRETNGDMAVVAVLAGILDGKATLAATATKAAQKKGVKAGALVKAVAQITGGNGGGKPDFAMAGIKDQTKIDEALAAAASILNEQI
ncbi:alanine--tRNA ligase [Anaeromassilibacillus senegalensis]|uniref:Alanine--tRNA ligase n=1 Tax=Anaeromassilibacillus senegalensis TaxID=1673717 RepID=A0ABS9CKH2_9FIRM|nr:alanine--tRNA ligase [Anaeromassilibacillus senegalensis]MCF2651643.1 alanine--tRNA ligase [Anaeromassilibacillus senegalensis]